MMSNNAAPGTPFDLLEAFLWLLLMYTGGQWQ